MPEALKCAKKLFEDDELTGLIGFTDYFINEFDCNAYLRVGIKDTATLEFYYHIVDHWEKKERQSFFHGFQRAALDFTRYT